MKGTEYPLLATKLYVPQPRTKLVRRTQLIDRLNNGLNHKLTLISASAGFGKTTLLTEWVSQCEIPVAWISLDKSDNDFAHFIQYFIASLKPIKSSIGKSALSVLQSPQRPTIETITINLIKEISDIPNDLVIIFDDYHAIDTQEIHKCVELLLDYLPMHIHFVIATRVDPPLPLARLSVNNQLTQLRTVDLCFTPDEVTLFFNTVMNLGLSNGDISILDTRTEGWVAGLQLAALSLQGYEDVPSFIKKFAGDDRHVVDYLVEEVLSHQSKQIQNFLLQTSILNRLSAPICDFITNEKDSQEILNKLEKINLFIVPLDNKRQWYRYHHLFAELLQQRLIQNQSEILADLHIRASKWYEKNSMNAEAINHALVGGDFEQSAFLIENQFGDNYEGGDQVILRRWLTEIPEAIVFSKPYLCTLNAWNLFSCGQLDAANRSLQAAENILDPNTGLEPNALLVTDKISETNRVKLLGRVATIRSILASYSGNIPHIIKYARQALEYLPQQELSWRSITLITLGDAYTREGELMLARKARSNALEASKASGDTYLILVVNLTLAETLRQQGELQKVIDICEQQLIIAEENKFSELEVIGWLLGMWGEVLAELNNLDSAIDIAKKGVKLTASGKDVFYISYSNLCLVRVLFSSGNLTGAEDVIHALEKTARKLDVPHWALIQISAWKTRIWLAQGKLKAVSQWTEERKLDTEGEIAYQHEMEFIILARILIAQKRLDEAIKLLQRLQIAAETGERKTNLIEILIIQMLAFHKAGDTNQAIQSLKMALRIAEPKGFIRTFVDEGPLMVELLEKVLDTKTDIPKAYIKKLLSVFKLKKLIKTNDGLVESLSDRELEVLRYIAAGLSNKKITEELFISISTVKTHLRNIYSKLDVNSRTQATVKAKELELL
jgi:LuxR family transcriptional regulator, maltose regulon positive regulatory protein